MDNVLVIGASRGIGLEFVRQYRADGRSVIATARGEAQLSQLRALGAEAQPLDVTDSSATAAFAAALGREHEHNRIDLALYVAGVSSRGQAQTPPTQADFDRVMHTNVLGAMQLLPAIAARVAATRGKLVCMSSGMGSIAQCESSHAWLYRVSKAALNMAVHAAQLDYPEATLVVLHPGWVKTDMGGQGANLTAESSVADMRKLIDTLGRQHAGAISQLRRQTHSMVSARHSAIALKANAIRERHGEASKKSGRSCEQQH